MSNVLPVIVTRDNGKKIRDYLKYEENFSTRLITKAGLEGRITVNGLVVKLNYKIALGDRIEINLDRIESQNVIPQDMDLDIIYEDKNIIIVNKPPFMVVHPTKSHQTETLSNGVLKHFMDNGESCIVRLVSRLDMDTSGLIIVAKNQFAHMFLAKEMESNSIDKLYLALVHGVLPQKSGIIDEPIGRENEDSIKREVMSKGKRSVTHYRVIEEYDNASLVELRLETGRTHQIRVHLSYLGNPIIGDKLYGIEDSAMISRQALHAYKLKFRHPITKMKLSLSSELPEDMKILLENLKKKE